VQPRVALPCHHCLLEGRKGKLCYRPIQEYVKIIFGLKPIYIEISAT